jgi:myosin-crossreactive antigen
VTTGSQAADLSVGSMQKAPPPRGSGRSCELWKRLAQGRTDFGSPDLFFNDAEALKPDTRAWLRSRSPRRGLTSSI